MKSREQARFAVATQAFRVVTDSLDDAPLGELDMLPMLLLFTSMTIGFLSDANAPPAHQLASVRQAMDILAREVVDGVAEHLGVSQ
jgi:hypothetical protein